MDENQSIKNYYSNKFFVCVWTKKKKMKIIFIKKREEEEETFDLINFSLAKSSPQTEKKCLARILSCWEKENLKHIFSFSLAFDNFLTQSADENLWA